MKKQLKIILLIFPFLIFFSCKNEKNSAKIEKKESGNSVNSSIINSNSKSLKLLRELKSDYKIHSIGHADLHDITITDTTCVIGNNKYLAAKDGYILFNKDTIRLETDLYLEKTFVTENEKNIYIFYTFVDFDSGGSKALCVDKKSLKINWEHYIGGFNLSKPIIDRDIIYFATLGHLSKLSLKTGEFYWRLDGLYQKHKINYVENTLFQDSLNLYIYRERHPSKEFDTLFVNDKTGKITKHNNAYN